jgi:hypothetical protein
MPPRRQRLADILFAFGSFTFIVAGDLAFENGSLIPAKGAVSCWPYRCKAEVGQWPANAREFFLTASSLSTSGRSLRLNHCAASRMAIGPLEARPNRPSDWHIGARGVMAKAEPPVSQPFSDDMEWHVRKPAAPPSRGIVMARPIGDRVIPCPSWHAMSWHSRRGATRRQ